MTQICSHFTNSIHCCVTIIIIHLSCTPVQCAHACSVFWHSWPILHIYANARCIWLNLAYFAYICTYTQCFRAYLAYAVDFPCQIAPTIVAAIFWINEAKVLTLTHTRQNGPNPNLEVGGIIMTMFDIRTNLSRQVVSEVKSHFLQGTSHSSAGPRYTPSPSQSVGSTWCTEANASVAASFSLTGLERLAPTGIDLPAVSASHR